MNIIISYYSIQNYNRKTIILLLKFYISEKNIKNQGPIEVNQAFGKANSISSLLRC